MAENKNFLQVKIAVNLILAIYCWNGKHMQQVSFFRRISIFIEPENSFSEKLKRKRKQTFNLCVFLNILFFFDSKNELFEHSKIWKQLKKRSVRTQKSLKRREKRDELGGEEEHGTFSILRRKMSKKWENKRLWTTLEMTYYSPSHTENVCYHTQFF